MKPTVSPRVVAILILGLLSPLAVANPAAQPNHSRSASNGSNSASAEMEFYLPAPATTRKPSAPAAGTAEPERGSLRTRSIQRKVNTDRLTPYEVESNSFATGLAAAAAAYREASSRR